MDIIQEAIQFEKEKRPSMTTSDRILVSRKAKELILSLNEIYQKQKDAEIMDLMKRLTVIKRKIEKRLKGRPLAA